MTDTRTGETEWQYNDNNELLDSVEYGHEYDANGSLIAEYHPDGSLYRTFEYNAETRLSAVRDHDDELIAEYRYDPFGRRVSKTVYDPPGENPETTWYIYSDQGLMAELDGQDNQTDFYLFPPEGLWSTDPILRKSDGIHFYYQTDHLGTPQQLIDSAGTVVHSREMRAFGEVAQSGMEDRLRFPGQLHSRETGLYYNYFRDYEPGIGRYVQSDPIGLSSDLHLHLYLYVNGSPVDRIDERGYRARRDRRRTVPAYKTYWDDVLELPRFMDSVRCQNLARGIATEHDLNMDLMEYELPAGCRKECHICVRAVETMFGLCPAGKGVAFFGDPGPMAWNSNPDSIWICTSRMLYGKRGDVCPVGC